MLARYGNYMNQINNFQHQIHRTLEGHSSMSLSLILRQLELPVDSVVT
jgi:hypothetical protein